MPNGPGSAEAGATPDPAVRRTVTPSVGLIWAAVVLIAILLTSCGTGGPRPSLSPSVTGTRPTEVTRSPTPTVSRPTELPTRVPTATRTTTTPSPTPTQGRPEITASPTRSPVGSSPAAQSPTPTTGPPTSVAPRLRGADCLADRHCRVPPRQSSSPTRSSTAAQPS